MNTENTATPRQRWALFCITKKDYRNEILSKEEAAKLIKELGNPNYKKASKKTIEDELLDYLKSNINSMYEGLLKETGFKSVLESDIPNKNGNKERWAFVGYGCGITWLKYNKNNKKAKSIDEAARKYRGDEVLNMLVKKFPKKDYNYLKKIGCPLEAIWYQMFNLQNLYYRYIVDFARTKGIEMRIESRLD